MSETLTGSIKRLKDEDGSYMFPITSTSAVYTSNGKTVEELIAQGGGASSWDDLSDIPENLTYFQSHSTDPTSVIDGGALNANNPEFTGDMTSTATTTGTDPLLKTETSVEINNSSVTLAKTSKYNGNVTAQGSTVIDGYKITTHSPGGTGSFTGHTITLDGGGEVRIGEGSNSKSVLSGTKLSLTASDNTSSTIIQADSIVSGGDVTSKNSSGETVSLNELNSSISGINESLATKANIENVKSVYVGGDEDRVYTNSILNNNKTNSFGADVYGNVYFNYFNGQEWVSKYTVNIKNMNDISKPTSKTSIGMVGNNNYLIADIPLEAKTCTVTKIVGVGLGELPSSIISWQTNGNGYLYLLFNTSSYNGYWIEVTMNFTY